MFFFIYTYARDFLCILNIFRRKYEKLITWWFLKWKILELGIIGGEWKFNIFCIYLEYLVFLLWIYIFLKIKRIKNIIKM